MTSFMHITRSVCLTLLMAACMLSTLPKPAEAQVVTEEAPGPLLAATAATAKAQLAADLKDFKLDAIAWVVAKMAVQSMTKSLVNWINSGFEGSPAFVTDLQNTLQQVGDRVANRFVNNLMSDIKLKSPFQADIARIVNAAYYRKTGDYFATREFTLGQVSSNPERFLLGDFSQGGFRALNSTVWNPQNTPFGALMEATDGLSDQVSSAVNAQVAELDWGNGFLSWKGDCVGEGSTAASGEFTPDGQPIMVDTPGAPVSLGASNANGCDENGIQTPGSVIAAQLNETLSIGGRTLIEADEINEIVGALFSQLMNQVVGGIGLRGVSSSGSGGRGFIDAATDPAQQTDPYVSSVSESLAAYETDWQTIKTAATAASASLLSCSNATDEDRQLISSTIADADAALAKAARARALLSSLGTASFQASGAPGAPFIRTGRAISASDATLSLDQFLQNDAMPSTADIVYADTESKDVTDPNATPTLVSRMNAIVRACAPTS